MMAIAYGSLRQKSDRSALISRIGTLSEVFSVQLDQRAVLEASKLAGRRYYRRPLKGRLRALGILESAHPRNNSKEWTVD